jgi:hypothetical protein
MISGYWDGSYCLSSSAADDRFRSWESARSVAIKAGTRSAGFTLDCLLKIPARAGWAIIVDTPNVITTIENRREWQYLIARTPN